MIIQITFAVLIIIMLITLIIGMMIGIKLTRPTISRIQEKHHEHLHYWFDFGLLSRSNHNTRHLGLYSLESKHKIIFKLQANKSHNHLWQPVPVIASHMQELATP